MADFIHITPWARAELKKQKCPFCKNPYREQDVCASGNRRNAEGKAYYFYEVECSHCKNPAMCLVTSRPTDSYQLALYLVQLFAALKDAGDDERPYIWERFPEELKVTIQSKITEAELTAAKKIIDTSTDHIEFLKNIGLTQQQIDKFTKPDKGKDEDK